MSEAYLNRCRCGGVAEFLHEDNGTRIYAQCRKCRIRTPSRGASLDTSAKQEVADIWNDGAVAWLRWIKPAVKEDGYDLDDRVSHTTGKNGALEHWISHYDGKNVWAPGESGWTLVGPAPVEKEASNEQ